MKPTSTPLPLGSLALQTGASAKAEATPNLGTGTSPVVATGSIPTTSFVVAAHVVLTPKKTGVFRVTVNITTGPNQNGAAQSITPGVGTTTTAPTDGTTSLSNLTGTPPPATAATGSSASTSIIYTTSPEAIGTPVYFCALIEQSVAGAFALAAGGATVTATEF